MDIKGLKLSNGMDLVVKSLEENLGDNIYSLERAVAIHITQTEKGPSMGFLPLTFFGKDSKVGLNIELAKHHVLFVYEVNDDIKRGYQEFATGLAVPSTPKIIV
ncbi:MAG: hypothetical protein H8D97_00440 [Proteobacteria bacterium]|nr:hypothetical protein [Pseudomonadota bacterium]